MKPTDLSIAVCVGARVLVQKMHSITAKIVEHIPMFVGNPLIYKRWHCKPIAPVMMSKQMTRWDHKFLAAGPNPPHRWAWVKLWYSTCSYAVMQISSWIGKLSINWLCFIAMLNHRTVIQVCYLDRRKWSACAPVGLGSACKPQAPAKVCWKTSSIHQSIYLSVCWSIHQ